MVPHGRVCYVKHGCRYETCRKAERDYRRAHRAKARGPELVTFPDAGTVAPTAEPVPDVPVVTAVRRELDALPASRSRCGLAASLIPLAAILDDRRLSTTAPSGARPLREGLKALREASHVAKGKLATVQSMTHRPS